MDCKKKDNSSIADAINRDLPVKPVCLPELFTPEIGTRLLLEVQKQ